MAVGLYLIYRVSLRNAAAARGWLARAGPLVTEAGLAAGPALDAAIGVPRAEK